MVYFIDRLQICEIGLAKTLAPSFKNLPDRLSKPAALFSFYSLRVFSIVSSVTRVRENFESGNFRFFS